MPPAAVLSGTLLLGTPSVQVVKSRDVRSRDFSVPVVTAIAVVHPFSV